MDARALAADLAGLGYDPVPVLPGTKRPMVAGYAVMPAPVQWGQVAGSVSVGLRAGGVAQAAYLDADEAKRPGTFANLQRYMAGLGYYPDGSYPTVKTRSDGRHVYVSFAGGLPGHVRLLSSDLGAGEFRYGPAAIVIAPGGDEPYTLLEGDLRQLPKLEVADVLPMLRNQDTGEADAAAAILATAPSTEPGHIGRATWRLLRGEGCDRYPSRSHAEMAIMNGLVNVGLSFGAILGIFRSNPAAGKFAELERENPQRAIGYLRRTWESAVKWTPTHASEGRKRAFLAMLWADARPWSGRTGTTDLAVFKAHALTGFEVGRETYQLGERELAERAGISQPTAHKSNRRILAEGLIERVKPQVADKAAVYRVSAIPLSLPHSPAYEGVIKELHSDGDILSHDAFRHGGLPRSAKQVWLALRAAPMTAADLAECTGRKVRTVYSVLKRMSRIVDNDTGEVFRLVEKDGSKWRALESDLDAIARALGTAGKGAKQRREHERQRQGWRKAIERQREERQKG